MLASGALAIVLLAVMVVVVTPRRTSNPSAISATTAPGVTRSVRSNTAPISRAAPDVQPTRIAAFTAIPTAIAAVPAPATLIGLTRDVSLVAEPTVLPDLSDRVVVLTDQFAYSLRWRDVAWLSISGDAAVLATDGSLVARFIGGQLIVTADTKTGSALAAASD
jgi:hypothetical protein